MVEQELEVATIRTHHLCAMFGYNCHLDLHSLPQVYCTVDDVTYAYVATWWQLYSSPRVTSNDLIRHCNTSILKSVARFEAFFVLIIGERARDKFYLVHLTLL